MKKASSVYAVVVADAAAPGGNKHVRGMLNALLAKTSKAQQERKLVLLPYAVTGGNRFQAITNNLEAIPWLLLDLRSRMQPVSLRIGVGIGEVSGPVTAPVSEMKGPAFRLARQALDGVGKARGSALTVFSSSDDAFDQTANLIYTLHDKLVRKMSTRQWKAVTPRMERSNAQQTPSTRGVGIQVAMRGLKTDYYGQLAAAAYGIEQLIGERLLGSDRTAEK